MVADHIDKKTCHWTDAYPQEGIDILSRSGGLVVSPTKVGYVLVATDAQGLERKFDAKLRKRNKPGVVLVADMDQLRQLAQLNPEIEEFYQRHWDADVLLGCILPWKSEAIEKFVPPHAQELMMDNRSTSCFVIKYGKPTENLVTTVWKNTGKLVFASSANPSGVGNKGKVTGIGERIAQSADLIVEADHYVSSIQADKDENTRYEQGVMVSMVDEEGKLIPEQKNERNILPAPIVIRKGLDITFIMSQLAQVFTTWDYRQGQYY